MLWDKTYQSQLLSIVMLLQQHRGCLGARYLLLVSLTLLTQLKLVPLNQPTQR
jgi:hypothetical protein